MQTYISKLSAPWETPFNCIGLPSTKNPRVMMYNFMGKWRLAPKEEFLARWTPAERPTN